jgi:hypothetical protein
MSKFNWKVWLYLNKMTDNPNDFTALVDTAGVTRQQQDIIDRIMAEGSEIQAATIKSILDRANSIKREFLLEGYAVNDDFIHLAPRVTGTWTGTESFTEGKHKVTVDAVVSKTLHEDLKQVGVEVLGVRDGGARIMLVTDVATQKTDGTVTPGDDILIAGNKIKVVGLPQTDGSLEPGIGVFFVAANGSQIDATRISENAASRVVARVPSMLPGPSPRLRIVTRYSGSLLLKTPRTIDYDLPLKVST